MLINAVRGTLERLASLVSERKPKFVALATDEDWRPEWRVSLLPTYKTHRTAEPVPPELEPQMPVIMEFLDAIGFDAVGMKDYEAEDVIGAWTRSLTGRVEIWSGDRDLFSLIRDPEVAVLYPEKAGLARINEAEVTKRYGIPGRSYAEFAVLRGDPSDGLPGIAGVGNKRAAELVTKYGNVERMIEAGAFKGADAAYLLNAVKVVRPAAELKLKLPAGRRDSYPAKPKKLEQLTALYGLNSSADRLVKSLQSDRS
jgi:5'-3' exonuclease